MKLDNQFNTKVVVNMAELMQIHQEFSTLRNYRSNALAELAVKKEQKYKNKKVPLPAQKTQECLPPK